MKKFILLTTVALSLTTCFANARPGFAPTTDPYTRPGFADSSFCEGLHKEDTVRIYNAGGAQVGTVRKVPGGYDYYNSSGRKTGFSR